MTTTGTNTALGTDIKKPRLTLKEAVVRFAGDSGDGMQLAGTQFTTETAVAGNDLATFPNFPAEIRAPAGSLYGVSSFQIKFGSQEVYSPGDTLDTLVAMNPAAYKVHLADLRPGGLLIVNTDAFDDKNLAKAGYTKNPLDSDPELANKYKVIKIQMTRLTTEGLSGLGLSTREADRSRNLFALGFVSWLYERPISVTEEWLRSKFKGKADILEANLRALKIGYFYAETHEYMGETYRLEPAHLAPGTYRNITGNTALAYGLITGAEKAGRRLALASYPITPASDVLHELSRHKRFGVRTFQAEDEIAAVGVAIGASYAGAIGITTTSGPGLALKSEAINWAVMTELPLVIVDIQRGGPSTGLPTKTEQADLLQALHGRNGESPVIILSASTPTDCFEVAIEAVRLSIKYMTPVILLSDGFIANGSEPWRIPSANDIPSFSGLGTPAIPAGGKFLPYERDAATLARPWVIPGTPGLEYRIGGIEKQDKTGNISYDPSNHDKMVRIRAEKVQRVAQEIPPLQIDGPAEGELLVIGWGSTYGAIAAATHAVRETGKRISHIHLRHLNPLPSDLGDSMRRFKKIVIPEINLGQLRQVINATYNIGASGYNRVAGVPLTQAELEEHFTSLLAR